MPGSIVRIPALYPNKDRYILDVNISTDPTEQNLEAVVVPLPIDKLMFQLKASILHQTNMLMS